MKKTALLRKMATDSVPEGHWGLPEQRRFPLDTAERVKMSQEAFPGPEEEVELRIKLAHNIVKRAAELGIPVQEKIASLASGRLNPDFPTLIDLRKKEAMHLQDPELELLKKLAMENANRPDVLVKVAATLQALDRATGSQSRNIDAGQVVFGEPMQMFKQAKPVTVQIDSVKIASLKGLVSDEVIKHLEEGRPVHDLPWGVREVVASTLRGSKE